MEVFNTFEEFESELENKFSKNGFRRKIKKLTLFTLLSMLVCFSLVVVFSLKTDVSPYFWVSLIISLIYSVIFIPLPTIIFCTLPAVIKSGDLNYGQRLLLYSLWAILFLEVLNCLLFLALVIFT